MSNNVEWETYFKKVKQLFVFQEGFKIVFLGNEMNCFYFFWVFFQACFFATERTADVGFEAIKQEIIILYLVGSSTQLSTQPVLGTKFSLSLGFHIHVSWGNFLERFCSHVILIKLELVKSITCDYLKLLQALIALERDELEKEKDFCYANVIKCLRLR